MPVIEEAGVEFNKPTKQNCSPEREGGKKSLFGIHKVISDFFLSPLIIQVEKSNFVLRVGGNISLESYLGQR